MDAMGDVRTDQLTEAQRACLRLVLSHHNSKEIAEIVGVSPSAVDKRLERAVQVLGATSRFAAARMLAAVEGGAAYERLPSDSFDLPDADTIAQSSPPDGLWWLVHRLLGLSPRTGGGELARNPLSRLSRLGVVIVLVFLISMSSVALLNVGQTLSSFVTRSSPAARR